MKDSRDMTWIEKVYYFNPPRIIIDWMGVIMEYVKIKKEQIE